MSIRLRATLAGAAFAVLQLAACGGSADPSPIERDTAYGKVAGADESASNGTYAWRGVPYAQAPVGALRWRAPVAPANWTGVRDTKTFGNACVQTGRLYGPGSNNRYDATIGSTIGQTVGSEDCLYLNIWRPANTATLPVIVFVHGGSNISGYTADPVYDGAALSKAANAVVVSVNYRLGIFGFLNAGSLKTGGTDLDTDSGNFALLDVLQALRFVNRNIGNFGGSPGNVTLMGHSAGAVNIYALLASPRAVNANPALFHRLVPLSGGLSLASRLPAGSLPTLSPASTYQAQSDALLQQLVIADGLATNVSTAQAYLVTRSSTQLAAYLRGKSADTLLNTVLTRLAPLGVSGSGPIPDGNVLPVDPVAAIEAGNYLRVPVMAGNTRDEGKLFPSFLALSPALGGVSGRLLTDAQVFSLAFAYDPDGPPATTVGAWIPSGYLPVATPNTGFNARTQLLSQIFFGVSRDDVLTALKAQQPDVWYFRFDWDEEPAPFNDIYGAAHGFEMPFVFGNFGPSLYNRIANSTGNQPGRVALSARMMQTLGAFAATGNPNNAPLGINWPAWPSTFVFDASATALSLSVQ